MTPELQKRIEIFLTQWHEAGRESFERLYRNLDYDSYKPKTAKERSKYVALDTGTSGAFLLEKETGEIFAIKSRYGVPDRRKRVCNIWDAGADGGILYQNRRY